MPRVTLVQSPGPRQVLEQALDLPEGATVRDALQAAGLPAAHGGHGGQVDVGVWGRHCEGTQVLREGDRVEIYRPLVVDPKVARRERFRRQGARAAGLFAARRPGAKQGY